MIGARTKVVTVVIEDLQRTNMMERKHVRISNSWEWEGLWNGEAKKDFQLYHLGNMDALHGDGEVENREGRTELDGGLRNEFALGCSKVCDPLEYPSRDVC